MTTAKGEVMEQERDEVTSGEVTHGGEGDPLGGGVAELEEDENAGEGVPTQDGEVVGE